MITFYLSLAYLALVLIGIVTMVGTIVWDKLSDEDFYWECRKEDFE